MKAMLTKMDRETELLKKETHSEIAALKSQLEVRNTSTYKVFFSLTSWEFQLVIFFI
jgi:hypothetical protein